MTAHRPALPPAPGALAGLDPRRWQALTVIAVATLMVVLDASIVNIALPQCPACQAFEQRAGATLAELRDAGRVQVLYKPIAFLDRASTDRYSTRALNAAACLLDQHPQGFEALHTALFAAQPPEGGPGLPDRQLTELVRQAGATDAGGCISGREFQAWTARVTEQASRAGVDQTPTVLVNGTPLTDLTADGLRAAVQQAS